MVVRWHKLPRNGLKGAIVTVRILRGDCREVLRTLPDESVHCVVTSPPYFGLRDYGGAGTTGLVADRLGRNAILIELNHDYAAMAERRIHADAGMFATVTAD